MDPDFANKCNRKEGGEALLCCPEDVEESLESRTDGVLSGAARIPICTQCIQQFPLDGKRGRREPCIPMALGHDNYWGFSTDLIVRYRVRWIEMAAVLPMWTHMIVYYVEGHEGHMMNEAVGQQSWRPSVPGQCFSSVMPWTEMVRELSLIHI